MSLPQHICFLDLETTGSDENARDASILEVGAILTDQTLKEISRFESLVVPANLNVLRFLDPVVKQMHMKNGLLVDVITQPAHRQVSLVDAQMLQWLKHYSADQKVAMAGSGVGHFDSRWIRKFMPWTREKFTYWAYDVGVVRRMLQLAGRGDLIPALPEGGIAHRALADAERSLEEARVYLDYFGELRTGAVAA